MGPGTGRQHHHHRCNKQLFHHVSLFAQDGAQRASQRTPADLSEIDSCSATYVALWAGPFTACFRQDELNRLPSMNVLMVCVRHVRIRILDRRVLMQIIVGAASVQPFEEIQPLFQSRVRVRLCHYFKVVRRHTGHLEPMTLLDSRMASPCPKAILKRRGPDVDIDTPMDEWCAGPANNVNARSHRLAATRIGVCRSLAVSRGASSVSTLAPGKRQCV